MPKIIICEDEHIVALDIKRQLEQFGYRILGSYPSAEEAIAACEVERPDLVLMDIQLQGALDGLEASRHIYDSYDVPVILLTAYADDLTIARAKDSLPFGYIIKPFEERELRTAIEIALFRHDMERKLRISEERYRGLFEEAPSANFTADAEGRITDCNGAFLRLLGYASHGDAVGTSLLDRFAQRSEGIRVMAEALQGPRQAPEEWVLQRPDGAGIFVLATVTVCTGADGAAEELRGYLVDITERRELEAQLRQAQKMEAIGRLAGGVAHDFNNIITAIMGYCNLLAEDVGDNPTLKDEVDGVLSAARRAVNLTRQLLAFSRKQPVEPRILDVNEALTDLEKMARRLVRENIALKFFLEAKHPRVSIDPSQFEQIIINLVVNAKDALSDSGVIAVETSNVVSDGSGRHHGIGKGEWLAIAVRDNGSGIAPEDQQRIFEPFFTTKAKDQGTGLGLSTVYAVVNRNGGRIALESELGKGTVFYVYLPVAAGHGSLSQEVVPQGRSEHRSGTILLAEDDDYLRGLLSRLLAKTGYRVLEAGNPGEAILIAEQEKRFALFTDVVMPHMNGYELADRLAAMQKDLRVLFMSGYHDKSEAPRKAAYFKSAFIQKPFSHEQLLTALDELLS